MDPEQRWRVAQEYEKTHWKEVAGAVGDGGDDLTWYRWKANRTLEMLDQCGVRGTDGFSIVEVGSGPVGLISYLPGAERHAVDPLMGFYNASESLAGQRPSGVQYTEGKGEELPLPEDSCDLVVIDNCLDHCEDPDQVLRECRRVLKPGRYLSLTLNVRNPIGLAIRTLMERYQLDPGHPHSYTPGRLCSLIEAHGFRRLGWRLGSWGHSVKESWSSNRKHAALKIATLTLERLAEGVWQV